MQSDYQEKREERNPLKRRISKTYDYRDEKGKLLFQCVRFDPKGFSQRRPDGRGGYIWNLKGIRRVLYRLPELKSGKDPVFICEGEKDVNYLREWNLTATCNPMGALKWKIYEKEYNPFLKDRQVIIIPDNDLPNVQTDLIIEKHLVGKKHLIQVATSLAGIPKSIRILRLPDAKDFSDWKEKDKNNTEEKFLMLVAEAPDWKEIEEETVENINKLEEELRRREGKKKKKENPPEQKAERIFITGRQLVEEPIEKLEAPIGNGFFVPERYTILAASDGEGKTTFCLQLALSAITGTTFLDFFLIPKPAKVLYFCGENSRGDIKEKVIFQRTEIEKVLERSIIKDLENNLIIVEPININFLLSQTDKQELYGWIEDHKPNIVIFDPLADFISSTNSISDDRLARGTVRLLTELAQVFKCFPLLTTHFKKEAINPVTGRSIVTLDNAWDMVHGSKYWLNSAASQIVIIRANLQRYAKAKKIGFKFKTVTEVKPRQVLRNENLWYEELPSAEMDKAKLTPEDIKEILDRKFNGRALPSILEDVAHKELNCTQRQIRDLVKLGKEQGLFWKNKVGEIEATSLVDKQAL